MRETSTATSESKKCCKYSVVLFNLRLKEKHQELIRSGCSAPPKFLQHKQSAAGCLQGTVTSITPTAWTVLIDQGYPTYRLLFGSSGRLCSLYDAEGTGTTFSEINAIWKGAWCLSFPSTADSIPPPSKTLGATFPNYATDVGLAFQIIIAFTFIGFWIVVTTAKSLCCRQSGPERQ